jgi:hypothetical protein
MENIHTSPIFISIHGQQLLYVLQYMLIIYTNEILQVAKEDAVDLENPPNTKLFNPEYCNDPDTVLLSRCHRGLVAANQNAPATPNIVIQNDFEGLAGLLLQRNPALPASVPNSTQSAPHMTRAAPALVPKMTLVDFCEKFDLFVFILQKLNVLHVTGPHALWFISNQQLVEVRGMDIGQLVDVRDAQEHWGYGQGSNENQMN